MQGADFFNFQRRGLFKQVLHLRAILAHDADIVAPGLVRPILAHIQRAELAEAVGGEKHLVLAVVSDHDLGPVNHGRKHEGQGMLSQQKGLAVLHHDLVFAQAGAEELVDHGEGLGVGHDRRFGISVQEAGDVGGMIGLHVLHHQIIRFAPAQNHGQIIQPFMLKMLIHRVHHGDFLVQNHIGIIGHSVGHGILALKQVYLMIVHACIANIVRNGHKPLPFCQRGK